MRLPDLDLRVNLPFILFNLRLWNRVRRHVSAPYRCLNGFLPHFVNFLFLISKLRILELWTGATVLLFFDFGVLGETGLLGCLHLVHGHPPVIVDRLLEHIDCLLDFSLVHGLVIAKLRKHYRVELLRKPHYGRVTLILLLCAEIAGHVRFCTPQWQIEICGVQRLPLWLCYQKLRDLREQKQVCFYDLGPLKVFVQVLGWLWLSEPSDCGILQRQLLIRPLRKGAFLFLNQILLASLYLHSKRGRFPPILWCLDAKGLRLSLRYTLNL